MMSMRNTIHSDPHDRQVSMGCTSMMTERECMLRRQQDMKRHLQDAYKQCMYDCDSGIAPAASVPEHRHQQAVASVPSPSSDALTAIVSLLDRLQRLQVAPVDESGHADIVDNNITTSVQHGGPTSPASVAAGIELYKTELCRAYEERGQCRYGDKCQFAHGMSDLRTMDRHPKYKTEMCRTYHSTGFCPYGSRCHFVHNELARSMATASATTAPEEFNRPSSSPSNGVALEQDLAQQLVVSLVAKRPSDSIPRRNSPVRMSQRGMFYSTVTDPTNVTSQLSMTAPSGGVYSDDFESMLLQHRRRQNLMTLTLLQSSSNNASHGGNQLLVPPPGGQCRQSPPLSAGDSGFSSSTGSPTLSEVFSPTMSPAISPPYYRSTSSCLKRPPSGSKVAPMYTGTVGQRDLKITSSPPMRGDGLVNVPPRSVNIDARSRHFFGI